MAVTAKNVLWMLLACLFPLNAFGGDEQVYKASGLFSVTLPKGFEPLSKGGPDLGGGFYAWSNGVGQKVEMGIGKGDGSIAIQVLNVAANSDEKRKSEVGRYFDRLDKLQKIHGKFKVVERRRPEKMADRVYCEVVIQDAKGKKGYYKTLLVFAKKTFSIQVTGYSQEAVDQLLKTAESGFKVLAK